jgi:hypothetical protein
MAAKKPRFPGIEKKLLDLICRVDDAMLEAVDNEIPAEDAPVYIAGRVDMYAGNVLLVLEDLGIKLKRPSAPKRSKESSDG